MMQGNKEEKQKNELICEVKSQKLSQTGIGFSQRDKNVKIEEEKGNLEFRVISNNIYK